MYSIWSAVLAGAKAMIITKNGTDETTLEYDILYITRTSFYVDSGSEIRIPIFHLWHLI
jgi:hypothetical protein